jgi:transposase
VRESPGLCPMSKPSAIPSSKPSTVDETFRRIEVVMGAGRRRIWPDDLKTAIVLETLEEGASVSEVARRHGVASNQVFRWRRKAQKRLPAPGTQAAVFAPVVTEPDLRGPAPHQSVAACAMIEVEIADARVRIPVTTAPEAIQALIEGLSKRRR